MADDRSTGGLTRPAVPPAPVREHPAGFRPAGSVVELSYLKIPRSHMDVRKIPGGRVGVISRKAMRGSTGHYLKCLNGKTSNNRFRQNCFYLSP